jgi:hypothetical protein
LVDEEGVDRAGDDERNHKHAGEDHAGGFGGVASEVVVRGELVADFFLGMLKGDKSLLDAGEFLAAAARLGKAGWATHSHRVQHRSTGVRSDSSGSRRSAASGSLRWAAT